MPLTTRSIRVGGLVTIACLLMLCRPSLAWKSAESAAPPLGPYLDDIKAAKGVSFVSDCQLDDHSKALMIIRPNNPIGQFYAIYDRAANGSAVVSIEGRVNIAQPIPQVIWTDGVTTSEIRKKLGESLLNQPFRLVPSARIDDVFRLPANQLC
jgi:hypothetical protein